MLAGENTLVAILSIAIGAILGELLQLDEHMHQLGDWVERKFGGKGSKTSLSEGFVTASLLFCVGAMAIMGALDSGLTGDHSTLYAKALLDGIISVVYASTLGIGVALSAIPIFLYQGAIALGASFLAPYLTEAVILEMKCVGSILILGLSLNMLGLTKIKVMNYVPADFCKQKEALQKERFFFIHLKSTAGRGRSSASCRHGCRLKSRRLRLSKARPDDSRRRKQKHLTPPRPA